MLNLQLHIDFNDPTELRIIPSPDYKTFQEEIIDIILQENILIMSVKSNILL